MEVEPSRKLAISQAPFSWLFSRLLPSPTPSAFQLRWPFVTSVCPLTDEASAAEQDESRVPPSEKCPSSHFVDAALPGPAGELD